MSKDWNGTYHPGKGMPSGANKEEGLGLQATSPDKMDEYLQITDGYTDGSDQLAEDVPLRHPDRNPGKGEVAKTGQNDNQ